VPADLRARGCPAQACSCCGLETCLSCASLVPGSWRRSAYGRSQADSSLDCPRSQSAANVRYTRSDRRILARASACPRAGSNAHNSQLWWSPGGLPPWVVCPSFRCWASGFTGAQPCYVPRPVCLRMASSGPSQEIQADGEIPARSADRAPARRAPRYGARKRLGGFEAADCHPLYGPKGSRPS
jgi:hypothetical protein